MVDSADFPGFDARSKAGDPTLFSAVRKGQIRAFGEVRPVYERIRDLPRLLPFMDVAAYSGCPERSRELVALLERALRVERQRGIGGAWSYSIQRHALLLAAYRSEKAALAGGGSPGSGSIPEGPASKPAGGPPVARRKRRNA